MDKLFNAPALTGMQALFNKQYKLTPKNPYGWRVVCWGTTKILIPKERFNKQYHFIQHYTEYQAAVARFFDTLELHGILWTDVDIHYNGLEAASRGDHYWQVALFDGTRFI